MSPILISLPEHYNYIGIFLTLSCNLSCSYCINHTTGLNQKRNKLNAIEWSSFINRLKIPNDLPVTLQGGEPTLYGDFYKLLKLINNNINLDLLTNLQFNPITFENNVAPDRFDRTAKYASIRVSYHPETMSLDQTISKAVYLKEGGYNIGFYLVNHPKYSSDISRIQDAFLKKDLDFRLKEFLGTYHDKSYGTYHYSEAVFSRQQNCKCKTSELLVSPEGNIYNCHNHLYNNKEKKGNILSPEPKIIDDYINCSSFGNCNPCDVKLKNNRFQQYGHSSVDIKDINPIERLSGNEKYNCTL